MRRNAAIRGESRRRIDAIAWKGGDRSDETAADRQLQGPTTRSEFTRSSRLVSNPVAATRFPTCGCSACGSDSSTRATGVDRFRRKPVRQLRAFGASTPSVSVKRNSSWLTLISRQPVIVTGASPDLSVDATAAAGSTGFDSGSAGFAAASSVTGAAATAADGAVDFAASPLRVGVVFDAAPFFDDSRTARGATLADDAAGDPLAVGA